MQKLQAITLVAIQNMAKLMDYQDAKWVMPLIKQKIEWKGVKTFVHVCRLGLNEYSQSVSDLLIYIDGFGGISAEVETKAFYKNKKRLKVVATVQGDDLRIDFNPTEKEVQVPLVWENQWGYYDLNKVFVPVTELPKEPIKLKFYKGEHSEKFGPADFIHPNIITWQPQDMETALNLFNEDFTKNECLHDNWGFPETNEEARTHIASIVDSAADIREGNKAFYAWWDSPARKEMLKGDD